jgi:hypothetical protein
VCQLCGTKGTITRVCHCSLPQAKLIESTPFHPIPVRSMLPSHLACICIFVIVACIYRSYLSHLHGCDHPSNVWLSLIHKTHFLFLTFREQLSSSGSVSHIYSRMLSSILVSSILWNKCYNIVKWSVKISDCLYGLVVRIPGYRSRGSSFDSQHYQIFWKVVGLVWSPLSLVSTIEELASPVFKLRIRL